MKWLVGKINVAEVVQTKVPFTWYISEMDIDKIS
jgi:hypothetical protein